MSRAVSTVIGVALLVALTVIFSVTVFATVDQGLTEPAPTASLTVSADATTDTIKLSHQGGDELDVTEIDMSISIDGEELQYQPPVPFFAAEGFESGPVGAFNSASENTFRAGETTGITLATTNTPQLQQDAAVTVQITTQASVLYDETTTAR